MFRVAAVVGQAWAQGNTGMGRAGTYKEKEVDQEGTDEECRMVHTRRNPAVAWPDHHSQDWAREEGA